MHKNLHRGVDFLFASVYYFLSPASYYSDYNNDSEQKKHTCRGDVDKQLSGK